MQQRTPRSRCYPYAHQVKVELKIAVSIYHILFAILVTTVVARKFIPRPASRSLRLAPPAAAWPQVFVDKFLRSEYVNGPQGRPFERLQSSLLVPA